MAVSQSNADVSNSSDPFDLSSSRDKVGKLGLPTVSGVAELEKKAKGPIRC